MTRLGYEDAVNLPLSFPGEPGIYRLEVVFRDGSGKRIGRFGEYVRVLHPHLDARLSLNGTAFRPDETVDPRLENYGAALLSFGFLGAYYEYFDGSTWMESSFGNGPVLAIGLAAGPGESAACWDTKIPPGTPAGLYRFNLRVDYSLEDRGLQSKELILSSDFQVLPSLAVASR